MRATSVSVRLAVMVLFVFASVSTWAAQSAKQTATEFYTAYRAAFAKAKTIEDIVPYLGKGIRAKIEATPAAERPKMFEFVKMMSGSTTNVKVLKETKTEQGVTLTAEGMQEKEKVTGEIEILREDGVWKMGLERWSNKS